MAVLTRWRAAAMHLTATVVIGAAASVAVLLAWYPGWLLYVAGGTRLLALLWLALLVAGPLLTLLVYRAGKWGMRFDLWIIAICQCAALLAALWMLAMARPVFVVYAIDRYIVLAASQVDDADLAMAPAPYDRRPWNGPRWVAAIPPADAAESEALLTSALDGKDIEYFPRYYQDYTAHAARAAQRSQPLAMLRGRNSDDDRRLAAFVRDHPEIVEPGYLPLIARQHDYIAVLAVRDGTVRAVLPIMPW